MSLISLVHLAGEANRLSGWQTTLHMQPSGGRPPTPRTLTPRSPLHLVRPLGPGCPLLYSTPPMDLKQFIRDIPDFPQQAILSRDITPLLQTPQAFEYVVDRFTDEYRQAGLNAVVAIESRGFLFGAPLARSLGVSLVPVRKAGKLPAKHISVEYSLEYGTSQLDIHEDALKRGQKALVVDDLLATGGTANAGAKLRALLGAEVHGMAFVVPPAILYGREPLPAEDVLSLASYELKPRRAS